MINKIIALKKKKNAIILAHSYQNTIIDEVADFVGDSLYLSQMAKKTDANIIIFAGVYFMAQTAKIISPDKKVLLPNMDAGCLMADMINLSQIKKLKSEHPNIPTVCYINSTAEVKSECDICCTSSNAIDVVKSLNAPEVLFVPDANLGKWVDRNVKNTKVITYDGNCPVHNQVTTADIIKIKNKYPYAKLLIHPECKPEISFLGDFIGSTSGIINYVKSSSDRDFIVVTEKGVTERLQRDFPTKIFIQINKNMLCQSMKLTTLESIFECLKTESNEIIIDESIRLKSSVCIENMLKVSK